MIDSDKQHFVDIIKSLGTILPCKYCRDSYRVFIAHTPISVLLLDGAQDMSLRFVWYIHDLVNRKLNNCILPYSKLLKRLSTTAESLTVNDVLLTLACFAQNYQANNEAGMPVDLNIFCRALASMLLNHPAESLSQLGNIMQKNTRAYFTASEDEFHAYILNTQLHIKTVYYHPRADLQKMVQSAVVNNDCNVSRDVSAKCWTLAVLIDKSREGHLIIADKISSRITTVEDDWKTKYTFKKCKHECTAMLQQAIEAPNDIASGNKLIECLLQK
jgi:hypothetical protein